MISRADAQLACTNRLVLPQPPTPRCYKHTIGNVRYLIGALVGLFVAGAASLYLYDPGEDNATFALVTVVGCGLLGALAVAEGLGRVLPTRLKAHRLTGGTFAVATVALILVTANAYGILRDPHAAPGHSGPALLGALALGIAAWGLVAWQLPLRSKRFRRHDD